MKTLISTVTLLLLVIIAGRGQNSVFESALSSNAACGQSQGLLATARLLVKSPEAVEKRTFATVLESVKSPAPDVPFRDWRDAAAKRLLTERPARYQLKLAAAEMGTKIADSELQVIGWTTDLAANKENIFHGYPNPRFAVIPNPYLKGSVLSYEPPLQGPDLDLNPTLWMLPSGSLPDLAAGMHWRKKRDVLFQPFANDNRKKWVTELRQELGNKNAYRKLMACLRLVELKEFAETDVMAVLAVDQTTVELGAFTLFVIQDTSEHLPILQARIKDAGKDLKLIQGTALGAVIHFMNLKNSVVLTMGMDRLTGHFPRNPGSYTAELKAVPSVPLLLHIADLVKPEGKVLQIETNTMLYDLLRCARVNVSDRPVEK